MSLFIPPASPGPARSVGGLRRGATCGASYRNRVDLAATHVDHVEEEAREEVRREQARGEPDEQRRSEALDGTCPEAQQNDRGPRTGRVGVEEVPRRAPE